MPTLLDPVVTLPVGAALTVIDAPAALLFRRVIVRFPLAVEALIPEPASAVVAVTVPRVLAAVVVLPTTTAAAAPANVMLTVPAPLVVARIPALSPVTFPAMPSSAAVATLPVRRSRPVPLMTMFPPPADRLMPLPAPAAVPVTFGLLKLVVLPTVVVVMCCRSVMLPPTLVARMPFAPAVIFEAKLVIAIGPAPEAAATIPLLPLATAGPPLAKLPPLIVWPVVMLIAPVVERASMPSSLPVIVPPAEVLMTIAPLVTLPMIASESTVASAGAAPEAPVTVAPFATVMERLPVPATVPAIPPR